MVLSTADVRRKSLSVLLTGRPIPAFLRALVEAFKATKTFIAQNTSFRGFYPM
jgi:hypothetical protein